MLFRSEPFEQAAIPPPPPELRYPWELDKTRPSPIDSLAEMLTRHKTSAARRDDGKPVATVHRHDDHTSEIQVRLARLHPGDPVCLCRFVLTFHARDDVRPFHAECSISTSDVVEATTLGLTFTVILKTDNR